LIETDDQKFARYQVSIEQVQSAGGFVTVFGGGFELRCVAR
jgi:hypothetical protein